MKFTVSSRQTSEYLRKANVIKVQWRDRKIIPDLAEKYPEATINLTRYYMDCDNAIDWNELNNYKILTREKLMLGLSLPQELNEARQMAFKHYYLSPVRTFEELCDLKEAGVCCVYLAAPLFFQLDKVKEFGIPVHAVANMANASSLFSRNDGVVGTWIRPEDVDTYNDYIDVIEFAGDITQEQALYRIYAEKKAWSGELGLLVKDLNYLATNRMIPPTLAETRISCGQKCKMNGKCKLCYRILDLANPDKIRHYLNDFHDS